MDNYHPGLDYAKRLTTQAIHKRKGHRRVRKPTTSRSASPTNRMNRLISGVVDARRIELNRDIDRYQRNKALRNGLSYNHIFTQLNRKYECDVAILESLDINDPLGSNYNVRKNQLKHRKDLSKDEVAILARANDWRPTT